MASEQQRDMEQAFEKLFVKNHSKYKTREIFHRGIQLNCYNHIENMVRLFQVLYTFRFPACDLTAYNAICSKPVVCNYICAC